MAVDDIMDSMNKQRKKPGPPKGKGKDPQRSIRVPDDEWEAWLEVAHGRGEYVTQVIRRLMNRWAARYGESE